MFTLKRRMDSLRGRVDKKELSAAVFMASLLLAVPWGHKFDGKDICPALILIMIQGAGSHSIPVARATHNEK